MCFGDLTKLQELVVDAAYVRDNIKNAVLGFSDQVPWWGFVQQEKQLYLHTELRKNGDNYTQTRGFDNDVAAKYRVTLELRQLVLNWFDDSKVPVGVLGTSLLIVGGVHCRLSNIDSEGRWIKTEKFMLGGNTITHIEGRSARGGRWQPT